MYLQHHGIKGQKWGIRRYQNPDGSLTSQGVKRYITSWDSKGLRGSMKYAQDIKNHEKAKLIRSTGAKTFNSKMFGEGQVAGIGQSVKFRKTMKERLKKDPNKERFKTLFGTYDVDAYVNNIISENAVKRWSELKESDKKYVKELTQGYVMRTFY